MLHKNAEGSPVGLISNIQKYTIHDGPGIRTELFFTGCTMNCLWCSNPETIQPQKRIGIYPTKCISIEKCGKCLEVCPLANEKIPFQFDENGIISSADNEERCARCMKCADVCPPRAIKSWGEFYTAEELLKIILEDRAFYARTGGGVTLSGGEVMLQWEFAAMLLEMCRRNALHTCVETALHCPWEFADAVFDFADFIITDIKHMDTRRHREITGVGNELILENIVKTSKLNKPLLIRTPVVPGYNSGDDNLRETARFLKSLPGDIVQWQLLPYRKMGTEKYASLGLSYPMGDYEPPERHIWETNLLRLEKMLGEEYGLPVAAGSSGKIG